MQLSIERPGKIICVGLNYRDHAEETGAELPKAPLLFAKWGNTLIGHGDAILLPAESQEVDYEAELGVVIGTGGRHISEADALDHGLRVANEIRYCIASLLLANPGQYTCVTGNLPVEIGRAQ